MTLDDLHDVLLEIRDEMRGLRSDARKRGGLPDTKIGKYSKAPQYEGKAASECPADMLLDYADFLEWKADKNRSEGKMDYVARDERTALLCRRWATVNRGVVAPPEKPAFRRAAEPTADVAPEHSTTKAGWNSLGSGWGKKEAQ